MNRIKELVELCNGAERFRISMMLNNAAYYVRSVVTMEVVAAQICEYDPEGFREERESTDRTRSNNHNAFISSVDAVNKICDAHGVPRIYTYNTEHIAYGDFAMELVADIFAKRH